MDERRRYLNSVTSIADKLSTLQESWNATVGEHENTMSEAFINRTQEILAELQTIRGQTLVLQDTMSEAIKLREKLDDRQLLTKSVSVDLENISGACEALLLDKITRFNVLVEKRASLDGELFSVQIYLDHDDKKCSKIYLGLKLNFRFDPTEFFNHNTLQVIYRVKGQVKHEMTIGNSDFINASEIIILHTFKRRRDFLEENEQCCVEFHALPTGLQHRLTRLSKRFSKTTSKLLPSFKNHEELNDSD